MLYLAITEYGYYLGFTEEAARRNGKQISGRVSLFRCYSLKDAEAMIRRFPKGQQIHEYEIIADKTVLFKPVATRFIYRDNLQTCCRINDKGEVEIRHGQKVAWKVKIDPETLQPDKRGLSLLQKEGRIPYYDFEAGKPVYIKEVKGKFKMVPEEEFQ